MSSTPCPAISQRAVRARCLRRSIFTPKRSCAAAPAMKPALWRVFSYLGPGLPRKATIHSTGLCLPKNISVEERGYADFLVNALYRLGENGRHGEILYLVAF